MKKIIVLGVSHDLQFNWNFIDQTANAQRDLNTKYFFDLVKVIIEKNQIEALGEEAGRGFQIYKALSQHGCNQTYFQEISSREKLLHFWFDLPPSEFNKTIGTISNEVIENWFVKIINMEMIKYDRVLVLMGAQHMSNVVERLKKDFIIEATDVTELDWYKDPEVAVWN